MPEADTKILVDVMPMVGIILSKEGKTKTAIQLYLTREMKRERQYSESIKRSFKEKTAKELSS